MVHYTLINNEGTTLCGQRISCHMLTCDIKVVTCDSCREKYDQLKWKDRQPFRSVDINSRKVTINYNNPILLDSLLNILSEIPRNTTMEFKHDPTIENLISVTYSWSVI